MSEKDVAVINTSDADMVAAYGTDDVKAVVTWNPLVKRNPEHAKRNLRV